VCLGKRHLTNLAQEPTSSSKELIMKKSIAILLVLVLASFGLFAMVAADPSVGNNKRDSSINIYSNVSDFSAFGVSTREINKDGFKSIAKFQAAVNSSIDTKVDMLDLNSFVNVGFLSGINNTAGAVNLTISIKDLVSVNNAVAMEVSPTRTTIDASKNSKFGTLQNTVIKVKEAKSGSAALAPAGRYSTTVTISLVTIS